MIVYAGRLVSRDQASGVLTELMLARGWVADEDVFGHRIAFSRAVRGGFVATAQFSLYEAPVDPVVDSVRDFVTVLGRSATASLARLATAGRWPKRPALRVDGRAGAECLPATGVLRAIAGDPTGRVSVTDRSARLAPQRRSSVTIEDAKAMRAPLAALVAQIDERARVFAQRHATVDAFLRGLRSGAPGRSQPVEAVVSLLIAFDRGAEAREVLAGAGENASPEQRRFLRQATRLLDGEVSLEQLGQALPRRPPPPRLQLGLGELRDARRRARDADDAVDAVRRSTAAGSRDARRVLLKARLAERKLTQTPMWVESRLDELEPGYEKPPVGSTLRTLRTLPGALREAVSSRDWEAVDPPWLHRPPEACYKMERASSGRAGIELDADIASWLDAAFAAAARRFELDRFELGYVELDLWFTASTDTSSTGPHIVACVGEQRVGLVDPGASQALNAILATAALRAELPWTVGDLNRRKLEPRYVLDFPRPVESGTPRTE